MTALVLGAGGAGRAAAWALREAGAEVSVWNRTPERASALAAEMGVASVEAPVGRGPGRERHLGRARSPTTRSRSCRVAWIDPPRARRRARLRRSRDAFPGLGGGRRERARRRSRGARQAGRALVRALDRPRGAARGDAQGGQSVQPHLNKWTRSPDSHGDGSATPHPPCDRGGHALADQLHGDPHDRRPSPAADLPVPDFAAPERRRRVLDADRPRARTTRSRLRRPSRGSRTSRPPSPTRSRTARSWCCSSPRRTPPTTQATARALQHALPARKRRQDLPRRHRRRRPLRRDRRPPGDHPGAVDRDRAAGPAARCRRSRATSSPSTSFSASRTSSVSDDRPHLRPVPGPGHRQRGGGAGDAAPRRAAAPA